MTLIGNDTNSTGVWQGLIRRYAKHLPVDDSTPIVSLLEGNTPLIRADRLAREIGGDIELYLKYEGLNPTASFKDRGMTVAVSKAMERGAEVLVCASTGNTSASAAAYAARAGIKCVVLLPHGKIALGKLAQALMHGATTVAIEGNFDDALRIVRELGETGEVEVVNSINPVRITAYWKGYNEYRDAGLAKAVPRMFGFQAANAAPLVEGRPIENPQTVATAIRIGNPASWDGAMNALKESNGHIAKVSDEEILAAYKLAARTEGVFAEPASAAPLAGLIHCVRDNLIPAGSRVVATLTGHGLKDPDNAISVSGLEPTVVAPEIDAVKRVIGL
jgi:threonine synthase